MENSGQKSQKRNHKKKLYNTVGEEEGKLVYESASTIKQAATTTRVTKIQEKETLDKEGNIVTLITTTKEGPSLKAAAMVVRFGKRWKEALSHVDDARNNQKHPGQDVETLDPEIIDELAAEIEPLEGEINDDGEEG